MTRFNYQLISKAKEELRHEMQYSAKRFGKVHARLYQQGLKRQIESICVDPKRYPGFEQSDIRLCSYRAHKIFYGIDEKEKMVTILGILSHYQEMKLTALQRRRKQ